MTEKRLRVFINIPRSHHDKWEELTGKKLSAGNKVRKYRYSVAGTLKAEKVSKNEFLTKLKEFRLKSLWVYIGCTWGVHGVYIGCT